MKKSIVVIFVPLVLIILIELYLIAFITLEYKQSNKDVSRNVESIRASYWASWYFGKELARLESKIQEGIYLGKSDNDTIQERLDFLIVSYDFLASDSKISPLLQAYAVKTLQSDIAKLDQLVLQVLANRESIKQYAVILEEIKKLKSGHQRIVFFELKGSHFEVFTNDIKDNQQSLLWIIYSVFLIVTLLLVAWSITYLNFKRTKALSNIDTLTLLPNRKRCVELITLQMQKKESLCCFFIDLNGFKQINDTIGHQGGDEVLKIIAKRVSHSISGSDIFARIGGDEFILILCDYGSPSHIEVIVERITNQIKLPIDMKGNVVRVGSAIGISFLSDEIDTVDKLFATADSAMYLAKALKEGNSSNYQYY